MDINLAPQRQHLITEHDSVVVSVGHDDRGRPRLTLAVDRDGRPRIEANSEADLADGIRDLNDLLNRTIVGAQIHNIR